MTPLDLGGFLEPGDFLEFIEHKIDLVARFVRKISQFVEDAIKQRHGFFRRSRFYRNCNAIFRRPEHRPE